MILVTGSTGFVGKAVVSLLRARKIGVREITRDPNVATSSAVFYVPSIDEQTDWSQALTGVEAVIHCAARVHQMNDGADSRSDYERVNTAGSLRLAQACVDAGVRRMVFVSTIKVCGDATAKGRPFTPDGPMLPTDDYGRTKAAAEKELVALAHQTGLELVIVRPPLVYGPGAKGNLALLTKLVRLRLPLPLGAINNQRSLVGLENLADFLALTAIHSVAPGNTFNVSDGRSLSTAEVLRILGHAMNRRVILLPIPEGVLRLAARVVGGTGYVDRLASNLEVDSTSCRSVLGWIPPNSAEESVASVVLRQPGNSVADRPPEPVGLPILHHSKQFRAKRIFDLVVAVTGGAILLPVAAAIASLVKLTSKGPALYWSDRIGKNNETFAMPKFRTMKIGTPSVATHLLDDPAKHLTSIGGFLRTSSLDELPQLWSVIRGHMSLVGPRPALYNQDDLVTLRTSAGVHSLQPGITGWAQINGRDELSIPAKVALDAEYLTQRGFVFDVKILWSTAIRVLKRDSVSH